MRLVLIRDQKTINKLRRKAGSDMESRISEVVEQLLTTFTNIQHLTSDPLLNTGYCMLTTLLLHPWHLCRSQQLIQPKVRHLFLDRVCPEALVQVLEVNLVKQLVLIKA